MPRKKTPWKHVPAGADPPLNADQIQELAARFNLHPDDLNVLNKSLAWALNATNRPRSVLPSVASPKEGARVFKEAMQDIAQAVKLLVGARAKLRTLSISTPIGEGKYKSSYQPFFGLLIKATAHAEAASESFEEALANGMPTYLREAKDQRVHRDFRRGMVCISIFNQWEDAGRPLSYTSDPVTNERKGPLVDFVNAIVAIVTIPSTQLSGETIKKEIAAYKRYRELERKLEAS